MRKQLYAATIGVLLVLSVFSVLQFWQIKPVQAATVFQDDFESGNLNNWNQQYTTGETTSVTTISPHNGTYQFKASCDGSSGGEYAYLYKDFGGAYTELYFRMYFNFSAVPDDGYYYDIMKVGSPEDDSVVTVKISREGYAAIAWKLCYSGGSQTYGTPAINTEYCLEVYARLGTSGACKLYLDSSERISYSGSMGSGTYFSRLSIGTRYSWGQEAHDIFIDSVYISTTYVGMDTVYCSQLGTTTTQKATSCDFYTLWNNVSVNLSGAISGTNNTGSWVNETWAAFTSQWHNVTKTLNDTLCRVEWEVWVNDSANAWYTTGLQYLITTTLTDRYYYNWNITDVDGNPIFSTGSTTYYPSSPASAFNNEIRVAIIHAMNIAGANYTLICDALDDYNITAIVIEIGGNNIVRYPSTATSWVDYDMFPEAIDAAHSHGMKIYAAFNVLADGVYSADGIERRQMQADGDYLQVMCPTRLASRTLLKNIVEELVTTYDVDGFMFDYIRYLYGETDATCYCDECKAKFIADTGLSDTVWPTDTVYGGKYWKNFVQWRAIPINELVRDMRGWMLAKKPTMEFSAAGWITYDGPAYWTYWLGQDWSYWVSQGWLDWVSPMIYTDNTASVNNTVTNFAQKYFLGDVQGVIPLVPCIDTCVDANSTTANFASRITMLRDLGCQGWVIWRYGGPGDCPYSGAPDLRNYLGNITESSNDPCRIYSINVTATSTHALINWTTTVASTTKVEYNSSNLFTWTKIESSNGAWYYDCDHKTGIMITDDTLTTDHYLNISSLTAGTTYYFRVLSNDIEVGLTAFSKVYTFTTPTGVSWTLSNSSSITYTQGQASLVPDNYTISLAYHGVTLNTTTLDTAVNGNTTIQFPLNMKKHSSTENGYIATNITTTFTVNKETATNLTVTMIGTGPFAMVVDVPTNATAIKDDTVAISDWNYTSSTTPKYLNFTSSSASLGVWEFIFDTSGLSMPPIFGSYTYSSARASSNSTFTALWADDSVLSLGWMGHNSTGTWQNTTAIALSGTTDSFVAYVVINDTVSNYVAFIFYTQDSDSQTVASVTYLLTVATEGGTTQVIINVWWGSYW